MQSIVQKLNNSNIDPCNEKIELSTEVQPAEANFHLSSADRPKDQPITNFVLSKKGFDKYNLYGVISMGLNFISYPWYHPPICPRNNAVEIIVGAVTHFGVVPTGYYTYESFATALNTMFGAMTPPLAAGTLTASISSDVDGRRLIITATLPYTIQKLSGLKRDLGAVMGYKNKYGVVNPAGVNATTLELYYTRFIDISSDVLGSFNSINDEASASASPNLVARLINGGGGGGGYIFDRPAGESGNSWAPRVIDVPVNPLKYFKWAPHTSITGIDFKVTDEFGDPAYLVDDFNTHDFEVIFLMRGLR
jgi:hypothetical protein